jgi:hypothetical protein
MTFQQQWFRNRVWLFVPCLLALAWTSFVRAQARDDLQELVPSKVDPCIVTITLDNKSEGSGFVVDAKGLVVTNYHVIEGAKSVTITFPDKRKYRAEGFLAISPTKDLALLRFQPRDKGLKTLKLADAAPGKGERVFAFGAPMGLSGSVSDGIVAAIRPGLDVRDTLQKLAKRDVYTESLGYDLDAEWIQSTAPISPGNSGGPLVNARGEVVGVNTWVCALGQNLNFSLSVAHLRTLLASAGTTVQPLASLPAPRPNREIRLKGDPQKTLAMWKQFNKLKNEFTGRIVPPEKKLLAIVPSDPGNPRKGLITRNKRKAALCEQLAKLYADYAANIKSLDDKDADREVAFLAFAEGEIAQRVGDIYQQFATSLTAQSDDGIWHGESELDRLKREAADLRTGRDLLRIKLARTYDQTFPTLEESAREAAATGANDATIDKGPAATETSSDGEQAAIERDKRSELRVWSDRSGEHQIQAKYRGLERGKAKLEKADGTIVFVPIGSLSEADQRFIGLTP